ncbi:hypothetical protein DTO164E3_4199 [Paecilomyces variotii]|nr:hypothetical protein DTO032I3_6206 [Paecilomyces variotii]KAJ9200188.1 hypothetical protein DTO164E3_4199 [Paecilomyces variotii]KAJ9281876.1 hypothetical protein DTO021D3_1172 [Paecilomyces variotii]KAJ9347344.1 hypothetical protein DTO027B6_218 [Paecilomyces variotii]KAJ9388649.1 hypothetical protein DTO032I4_2619 [Paecilomyces variotii]
MSGIHRPRVHDESKDDSKPPDGIQETVAPTDPNLPYLKQNRIRQNIEEYEQLFGVEEEAYSQPTTTKKELWSYYLYYNGDNGVGPGSYTQALFQWALNGAGFQPGTNPPKPCTSSSPCVVPWAGGTRSTASVVLIANGLCFTFMTVIRLLDPAVWDDGDKAPESVASSNGLARYIPHVRKAREEDLKDGKISQQEYDAIESLERNHISNVSTAHSNIGYLLTLVINLSVLLPLQNNTYSNNLALFLTNSYWIVLGIWWFICQQKRAGPKIPKGSNYATIGFKQVWLALREIRSLPQTFLYLVAFFLLADGLNTTGSLVTIIQNGIVEFSFLQITYLGIAQACCSIASTFGFWYIQKYFKLRTKPMFLVTNFFSVFIPFWGMLGLWTKKVGYHNKWEFYFYNIIFGLFQAPYYAYSQTMISELMPRGYDNMFFALFGITNRASSIIGPNVVQAIINDTENNWMGFPFLFAICAAAMIGIVFVDIEKGREDARKFAEKRKISRVAAESGLSKDDLIERSADGGLSTVPDVAPGDGANPT